MIWRGLKIKGNCHVLVSQFRENFRSKTLSYRQSKSVFRDVKWCFNASWGLKGLNQHWFNVWGHTRTFPPTMRLSIFYWMIHDPRLGNDGLHFVHIQAKLGQENLLRMVRWVRWHCPPDTGFEIQTLEVWGRARYLLVTEAPQNTKFYEWMGKKHFCLFETAETR